MYEDLVIELRAIESYGSTEISSYDAGLYADAIDGMNEIIGGLNETIKMYGKDAPCWIPVTERLPEEFENVLVANKRGKHYDIDKAWWNGSFFDRCAKGGYHSVTHWMPLPEPPKEETIS